jgi:hypothetical protein
VGLAAVLRKRGRKKRRRCVVSNAESSARDFEEAKEEVLEEALEDQPPGSQAIAQTEGEVDHSHGANSHVDGTIGTKEEDGSVSITKGHSEDD